MSGIAAGDLNSRVRFDIQTPGADDGYGNTLPPVWTEGLAAWAKIMPQTGREALAAGRLESTTLARLFIRKYAASTAITPAHRVVVTAGPFAGFVYQIRSIIPMMDNAGLEMVLEAGVAI